MGIETGLLNLGEVANSPKMLEMYATNLGKIQAWIEEEKPADPNQPVKDIVNYFTALDQKAQMLCAILLEHTDKTELVELFIDLDLPFTESSGDIIRTIILAVHTIVTESNLEPQSVLVHIPEVMNLKPAAEVTALCELGDQYKQTVLDTLQTSVSTADDFAELCFMLDTTQESIGGSDTKEQLKTLVEFVARHQNAQGTLALPELNQIADSWNDHAAISQFSFVGELWKKREKLLQDKGGNPATVIHSLKSKLENAPADNQNRISELLSLDDPKTYFSNIRKLLQYLERHSLLEML